MAPVGENWALPGTHATSASLTFFDKTTDDSKRAFWIKGPMNPGQGTRRTNMCYQVISDVPIHDLRAIVPQLSLDHHGFQLVHHPSAFLKQKDDHDSTTRAQYMDETAQLVKRVTSAEDVICYDLRYRENISSKVREELTTGKAGSSQIPDSPGWQVHVDQTREGGNKHVRRYLSNEQIQMYLMDKDEWRVRVINAWRPVSGTVGDAPLAFCDYTTICDEDLVPTDRPWNGLNREIYNLRWNAKQRWYWIRDQTPDEVTLFVNWDSAPIDGGAEFCAHAAFLDQNADPSRPPRRSIEVRALVITKRE